MERTIKSLDNTVQFAAIKPQTMTFATAIKDGARSIGETDQLHFSVTNRAAALTGALQQRVLKQFKLGFGGAFIRQQQRQFTAVEPDAPAGETMIDLELVELDRNHNFGATGAFHNRQYYTALCFCRYINLPHNIRTRQILNTKQTTRRVIGGPAIASSFSLSRIRQYPLGKVRIHFQA